MPEHKCEREIDEAADGTKVLCGKEATHSDSGIEYQMGMKSAQNLRFWLCDEHWEDYLNQVAEYFGAAEVAKVIRRSLN